jgi:hypothetical protein
MSIYTGLHAYGTAETKPAKSTQVSHTTDKFVSRIHTDMENVIHRI